MSKFASESSRASRAARIGRTSHIRAAAILREQLLRAPSSHAKAVRIAWEHGKMSVGDVREYVAAHSL